MATGHIPCVIHQTWKTAQLDGVKLASQQSFTSLNPECQYKLWTDVDVEAFMHHNHPDVMRGMWQLLLPVERADFFRYAVVFKEGGLYADVDIECMKPIREWGLWHEARLVVAYEYERPITEEERQVMGNDYTRLQEIEQFVFAAERGHPALHRAMQKVRDRYMLMVRHTLDLTGPGPFTDAVISYLEEVTHTTGADFSAREESDFHFPPPGVKSAGVQIFKASQVTPLSFHSGKFSEETLTVHWYMDTWKGWRNETGHPIE